MSGKFSKENRGNTLNGVLFVALLSLSAVYLSELSFFKQLHLSPLIIGIIIGVFYANTLRNHLPTQWIQGILFSTKTLLRTAIVFYGFRLTFQNISEVGMAGILISLIMVTTTFIIGYVAGTKFFKYDAVTSILISAGSAICGAAAILATESVVKARPYKSVVAVSTVVIFGLASMFLYPLLYNMGLLPFDDTEMGLFIGGTIHEVANAVGAGDAVIPKVAGSLAVVQTSVITKMIRVMLISPFLIILGLFISKIRQANKNTKGNANTNQKTTKNKITIPWFAILFIVVAGFNSFNFLPKSIVDGINTIDTFMLTMAMTALGMETNIKKLKRVGLKPFYIASILYIWLIFGGMWITKLISGLV